MTDPKEPDPAQGGKARPSIDPKSVMEDALKSIVKRADTTTGAPSSAGGSTPPSGTPKRTRNRKRRRPEGGPSGAHHPRKGSGKKQGSSPTGHANDAVRSLSAMVRQLLDAQRVHFLSRPRFMELNIRVPMDARLDGSRISAKLVDQVLKLVGEVRENDSALVPGAVYCFFSESAEADGCRPTEPRQVFDGYGSTGRPKFTDFVTMAIERKSSGIDALLAGEDITLTHITQGRVLRTAQLAEWGKGSTVYRILGQVDAGLFAVRGQEYKAAFSFQVLLGKDLKGGPVLRLHPVGMCDVMSLADHSVAQILRRFQGDLDEAALRLRGKQNNGDAPDEEEFVKPLLQDLCKRLSDRAKHRSRRTEHADRRSSKSTRPTNKAYGDAQAVSDADLLWDQEGGTFIVVGQQGRVHVFNAEARHVTSVSMNASSVGQRVKSHRWRKTEPGERGEFRMQLRALVKSHREGEQSKGKASKAAESAGGGLLQKLAQLSSPVAPPGGSPEADQTADAPLETPAQEAPVSKSPAPADSAPAGEQPAAEVVIPPADPKTVQSSAAEAGASTSPPAQADPAPPEGPAVNDGASKSDPGSS